MLIRFFEFLLFTSQLDDSSRETKKAPAGASTWALPTWPVSTLKKKGSKDWTGSCSTNKNAPSKLKPQTLPDLLQSDKWEEKKWCEIRSLGSHEHAMFCYTCLTSILTSAFNLSWSYIHFIRGSRVKTMNSNNWTLNLIEVSKQKTNS